MGKRKEKREKLNWKSASRLLRFSFLVWTFLPKPLLLGFSISRPVSVAALVHQLTVPPLYYLPLCHRLRLLLLNLHLRWDFSSFLFSSPSPFFERHFDVVPFQVQFGVGFIADTWLKCSRMPDECNCYTTDMAWHDWLIDWLTAAESLPDGFALGCNSLLDEDNDGSLIAWCGPTVMLLYKL